jgi:hypothetical protein
MWLPICVGVRCALLGWTLHQAAGCVNAVQPGLRLLSSPCRPAWPASSIADGDLWFLRVLSSLSCCACLTPGSYGSVVLYPCAWPGNTPCAVHLASGLDDFSYAERCNICYSAAQD